MNATMERSAVLSDDRKFRYELWRRWDNAKGYCAFIGLNPSTADENRDDPTIRRCVDFAMRWGYGALCMLNLWAFRATDPSVLRANGYPVGEDNDRTLLDVSLGAERIVAAWGVLGGCKDRDVAVLELMKGFEIACLGVTDAMFPKHPLYVPKTQPLLGYRKNEVYVLAGVNQPVSP